MSTRNYLFVSDLHLSEGRDPRTGKISRNEDFLYDPVFADFLVYHLQLGEQAGAAEAYRRPWSLINNGDFFDFLQVTSLPAQGDELEAAAGVRRYAQLRPNERRYGLGTSSRASAWKMGRIAAGHPLFFRALGWFLARNDQNQLVVIKGNHDVELFWPAVQAAFRRQVAGAYRAWYDEAATGADADAIIPFDPQLPAALDGEGLEARIRFPPWFFWEPGLFYVEHGNQYDPANAFVDFLNPILEPEPGEAAPGRDELIELPSGSLFVRYFFNQVEQVHPFADNLKPMTRYLRWALSEEPLATAQLFVRNWRELPGILGNLVEKEADPVAGQPALQESLDEPEMEETRTMKRQAVPDLPLEEWRREQLQEMRRAHLQEASARSRSAARGTAASVALKGGQTLALARAVDSYAEGNRRRLLVDLLLAAGAFVSGTLLAGRLDEIERYVDLPGVAAKVARLLNRPGDGGRRAGVPYYLFGHDHYADLVEIGDGEEGAAHRQWYVNTGCWLSTFAEQERLTRGEVQFTFFRLVPGITDAGDRPPALLEWLPQRRAVRPLLIFAPAEEGFDVAVEAIPDVTV